MFYSFKDCISSMISILQLREFAVGKQRRISQTSGIAGLQTLAGYWDRVRAE